MNTNIEQVLLDATAETLTITSFIFFLRLPMEMPMQIEEVNHEAAPQLNVRKAVSVSLMLMHVGLVLVAVIAMVMSMPSTSLAN